MNTIAFLDLTQHDQKDKDAHHNKTETLAFSILQQTLFHGSLEPVEINSEFKYGVILSEMPEATQSGKLQEVKYAIGFETVNLANFRGFKTHSINLRQRSLPLNLTSDTITEASMQIHWSYLSSMWTLPTTEDGELLETEATSGENPYDSYRWPTGLGTIYLIVQNMREVETLLSYIQFMSDKELIDPLNFLVLAINEGKSTTPPFHYLMDRVMAANTHGIDPETYCSSCLTNDDDLINKLDLSINETLKTHAANDSHFDRYDDYEDFQQTCLWLIDNRHPLTRALYRRGLIEITDLGRYLFSVQEINEYKDADTDDDDAEHVIHKQFALMEELVDRLRSRGIPCDYIHFDGDESPDVRNNSRSDHDFEPVDP